MASCRKYAPAPVTLDRLTPTLTWRFYGDCWGMCGGSTSSTTMTDNNGNLKKREVYVPNYDPMTSHTTWYQQYDYDSLNRLQRVHEYTGNTSLDWQQEYVYDRYGNRTIHQTNTWGAGINKKVFTVNTANNRLGVPSGQSGTMTYDHAGNLTIDTYSAAAVTRAYDAENHMTSETQAGSNVVGAYFYNATGQRVVRRIGGVDTWQVYGSGGELLAEYAGNGLPANPQKEYCYRNGQLLVTADAQTTGAATNVALAANGGSVTASSELSGYAASKAIDGDRKGGDPYFWADATAGSFPDSLEVTFNGSKTIGEIDVFTLQDNLTNPVEPNLTQTFSNYGATAYDVQYWDGSAWVTIPNGSVTGNNKVWRQFTFAPVTTSKIRVVVNAVPDNNYSRVVEVEAWTAPPPTNVAQAANGGTTSASSALSGYGASKANDGDRNGGDPYFWADATAGSFPDWVEVAFNGMKSIGEIDVFTLQDNLSSPVEPTLTQTFSNYGVTAFDVQYWDGSAWVTIPNGSVTGNNKVWRQFTFAPVTTIKIRVVVNAVPDNNYSRIVEVEAWTAGGSTPSGASINWLVTDQLGTPRMIFDQSGSLATTKRHDYLPFGEEVSSFVGLRSASLGHTGDSIRQKFTSKERDTETGLDYFLARYYSSTQGRFTSVDPLYVTIKRLVDPQRLNLYGYTRNNPLKYTDPNGMDLRISAKTEEEARKKYALLQKGLTAEDRKHTQFVVGDGKNGFAKGAFGVTADKDHKSESDNFKTVQKIANAKDVAVLNVVGPKEQITVLQASTNQDGSWSVRRVEGVTFSFTNPDSFAGHVFFPHLTKLDPALNYIAFSTNRNTEAYAAIDSTDEEIVATIHHELRHIVLGDFGRSIPKALDTEPNASREVKAAEDEAKKNFKSP